MRADGAGGIHGGHGQGVGVGSGRAAGGKADIVVIQIAAGAGSHRPLIGVTGRNRYNRIGFGQVVQKFGVHTCVVVNLARHIGAQRQVHRIAIQKDRVLNGSHVVGFRNATAHTGYLQGDDLSVGSRAAYENRIGSAEVAVLFGNVAVGSGDAGHMRAMAAEVVIVVRDAQICIHIVVAEGQLFIEIQILCRQLGGTLMNIQLGKHCRQLLHIQEVQRRQIRLLGQAGFLRVLLQSVQKCTVVKGLVVSVRTGVDDSNPAARAGVALLPSQARPGHTGGDIGLGRHNVRFFRGLRFVPLLHDGVLHAGKLPDFFQLTIGYVGGDDVPHQSQVPHHVQRAAPQHLGGDGLCHRLLRCPQAVLVGYGLLVFCNTHGGIARLDGGLFLQNNRDTDNVSRLIAGVGGDLLYLTVCQVRGRGVDVHLLPLYTSCPDRYRIASHKTDR